MKKAKLAMAFHCYQPVDNFDWTIEEAYQKAYKPLVETLEGFPAIKASFHFSGNLLEWLEKKHPRYIDKLSLLLRKGQIELIGGGFCEPIMALIPERDRRGQIEKNEGILRRIFKVEPRGAWITERVWVPELADTLLSSNFEYTILDDYHLFQAGIEADEVFNPYLVHGKNGSLTFFPSSTRLRYYIPFRTPKAVINYLKDVTQNSLNDISCFFFADDGEKFGFWPHTHWWVYKKKWLSNFFSALENNSDWLQTLKYSDVKDKVSPKKAIDIPESSYAEMTEWSGGNFKNFLKKYPGSHRMHRRMISVSDRIDKMKSLATRQVEEEKIDKAQTELYKAQSGCAYWHGTFGGFYFPHLRSGIYGHLIKAQSIIDLMNREGTKHVKSIEHDMGGSKQETIIRNKFIDLFVKSHNGGAISELDFKPFNVNLMNTISRIREEYHKKLKKGYKRRIKHARKSIFKGEFTDIHDLLGISEKGLKKMMFYDDYQRASFLTHVLKNGRSWKSMNRGITSEVKFLEGAYSSEISDSGDNIIQTLRKRAKVFMDNSRSFDLEVVKDINVGTDAGAEFSHKIIKHFGSDLPLKYAVEFNFSIKDKDTASKPRLERTDNLKFHDEYSGLDLKFFLNREFTVFTYPIYTVNESEAGLEKIYQGISILIGEDCVLARDGDERSMQIKLEIA